jgi:hypothetical protein
VKPHNLRQRGGLLIVPLFDAFGLLWNVQRIQADGGKRFKPGRAGGLFSPIGDLTDPAHDPDLRRMGDRRNAARGNRASGAVRDERGQPAAGGDGGAFRLGWRLNW